MENDELKEITALLKASGMEVIPTIEVPFFRNPVQCGTPTEIGDEDTEMIEIPASLVKNGTTFVVVAKGDSMIGSGIYEGDQLTIHAMPTANDGDVVVAMVDNQATVKVFFEDDNGDVWLLPQNEDYNPICLKDYINARILGKVVRITHNEPKVSYRECVKLVKKARKEQSVTFSQGKIDKAIKDVVPMIKTSRQWFAVYRVLVDKNVIKKEDFFAFVNMVKNALAEDAPSLNEADMKRMAVQSFSKPVILWDENNAPVQGKRFFDYLYIAKTFSSLLS